MAFVGVHLQRSGDPHDPVNRRNKRLLNQENLLQRVALVKDSEKLMPIGDATKCKDAHISKPFVLEINDIPKIQLGIDKVELTIDPVEIKADRCVAAAKGASLNPDALAGRFQGWRGGARA
jgi:hypothetical protein